MNKRISHYATIKPSFQIDIVGMRDLYRKFYEKNSNDVSLIVLCTNKQAVLASELVGFIWYYQFLPEYAIKYGDCFGAWEKIVFKRIG